jgi:tRNA (cmo5U34)-methyltransferase
MSGSAWQESDSKTFLDLGRVFTPNRDEIEAAIVQLIPAQHSERFCCVDVGAGEGWLSHRVLQRFTAANVIALDGSQAMLARSRDRLSAFGKRADVREFRLESDAWISQLPGGVRCFLSTIVLHHLDDGERWRLFRNLYRRLEPGGALLLADVVAPASDAEREYAANFWDAEVKRQALEMTGSLLAFDRFDGDQWNWYRYPDPGDKPSKLLDQLKWLEEVGFIGVSAFWVRAGHAVFGGFKAKT